MQMLQNEFIYTGHTRKKGDQRFRRYHNGREHNSASCHNQFNCSINEASCRRPDLQQNVISSRSCDESHIESLIAERACPWFFNILACDNNRQWEMPSQQIDQYQLALLAAPAGARNSKNSRRLYLGTTTAQLQTIVTELVRVYNGTSTSQPISIYNKALW